MYKTADPTVCRQKALYTVVLLMAAFCLLAHFLVEDVSLRRAANTASPGQPGAGPGFELEHQDDLAVAVRSPVTIPHNTPLAVAVMSIRAERQSAHLIRIPPKIA